MKIFKKLVEHNITSYNEQFFCHLCMTVQSNLANALSHINEKKHQTLKCDQTIKILENCVEEKYETLVENNVALIVVDMFLCISCKKVSPNLNNMLQHIQSETHVNKLKNAHISLNFDETKDEMRIATIKSKMWKKVRKIDLSQAECALLQDSCVIEGHEKHIPLKVIKVLYNYPNIDCETIVKNGIVLVDYHKLMCIVCYHCYEAPDDVLQHIVTVNHKFKIKRINTVLNENKDQEIQHININSELAIKAMQLNLPEIKYDGGNKSIKLFKCMNIKTQEEQITNNNEKYKGDISLIPMITLDNYQEEEYQIFNDKKVVIVDSGDVKSNSIKEKQHINAMKQQSKKEGNNKNITHVSIDSKVNNGQKELDVVKTQYTYEETVITPKNVTVEKYQLNLSANNVHDINSKDCNQMLLSNGITRELDTFLCTFCERKFPSLHDTLSHIKGKSHINVLKNKKYGSVINNIEHPTNLVIYNTHKKEHLIDTTNKDVYKEIQDKNKNDILKNCSYYCDLCSIQFDIDYLFEHINTVMHKCNIFLLNMGDDIILYKCFCCKSIMQGNSLLINHFCSEKHLNNLASTLKMIKTNNNGVFIHPPPDIENMLVDQKFSLCDVLIPQVEAMSVQFIEKCLIFFDTSEVKFCNDEKNNIFYYCLLCNAEPNTDHNLIEHCRSRMHMWKVKQLFLRKDNNDAMSVSDKYNKMCINVEKLHKIKTLGNDLTISADVYTEIMKSLNVSPFLSNTLKNKKNKEKTITERLNKMYYRKYLDIEEEIYTLSKQRLENLKLNFKLLMPYNEKKFYCLACKTNITKELYLLYEHVCHQLHITNVNENKANMDIKKLSNQYMEKVSENSIKCYPCGNFLHDPSTLMIDIHINTRMHIHNYKKFCVIIEDIFNCILQDLNSLWYSIQRFSCTLCKINFQYKLEFIEHVITKHNQLSKNHIFDFCIPCATLWLGQVYCYTEHCNDIMHKYLMKSKDFIIEKLPECIKKLLKQVDKTVDILIEQTEVLSNDIIHEEIIKSLERNVRLDFPSVKAFLFGSRVTGLGFANSDIDIYLDCESTYCNNKTECLKHYLTCIEQALHKQEDEWEIITILQETRTPIIKSIYKRTGVHCDISVTNGLSVENSKLIRSFIDAYAPCKKLILFVKKWFSLFNLSKRHFLTNYALVWIVIFYLQSKLYLPTVAALIKEQNDSRLICGWETGVAQPKSNKKLVQSISILLLNFFDFYANFDYQHYIICPLMGYPVAKRAFSELDTLPEEMEPYIKHLSTTEKPEYFRIDSPLCVQDPFDLSHNLTKAVNSVTLKYFKQYCQESASILLSSM